MSSVSFSDNCSPTNKGCTTNISKHIRNASSESHNEEPAPDAVLSTANSTNENCPRSPFSVNAPEIDVEDSEHTNAQANQREAEGTLSLVQNLLNQVNTLRDDLRHLEKRCKFLEQKCTTYHQRQRKMERAFFKKEKEMDSGDGDVDNGGDEEESVDEEAAADFYAGGDEGDEFAASIDGADVVENDANNNKRGKGKIKRKVASREVVFPARSLDFNVMFERLRVYHRLHGTCNVSLNYGDKQLRVWSYQWRNKRRKFDKMVQSDGGPSVVFPGLDDIDAKTYSKDEIPQYNYEWEDERVKHLETKESRHRRRYLLRTRHHIKCLNTLDFNWNITEIPSFEDRLKQLQKFIEEYGHYNVPRSYSDLGNWFHKMKGNFVFGKKHFMENQYPKLLEMGVDMNVAVQGRKRRKRKRRNDGDVSNEDHSEVEEDDCSVDG
mmetsp:Transcript_4074/g.9099  ORF Transcript_4074/g.9099 Transcript_4074/m.9099 type:complete len:436 (-) Transcript_4074:70-1377(-)